MKPLILLTLFWPTMALSAQALSDRMTDEEFRRAGLDKLNRAELAYLEEWLAEHGDAIEVEVDEDRVGFAPEAPEPVVITSPILGKFTGWRGRTVFELANGQVWQQAESGNFYYPGDDPIARIEPKAFGSWKLYVEGYSKGVKVKRIR